MRQLMPIAALVTNGIGVAERIASTHLRETVAIDRIPGQPAIQKDTIARSYVIVDYQLAA